VKTGLHDRRRAAIRDRVAPDTGPMTGSITNQQPSTIRGEAQGVSGLLCKRRDLNVMKRGPTMASFAGPDSAAVPAPIVSGDERFHQRGVDVGSEFVSSKEQNPSEPPCPSPGRLIERRPPGRESRGGLEERAGVSFVSARLTIRHYGRLLSAGGGC
jgi:hypothetical protein